MSHATTIDAASARAELESPIVLSLSKEAPVPLIHHTIKSSALTATEHAVLHWLATGRTNAQIADHLDSLVRLAVLSQWHTAAFGIGFVGYHAQRACRQSAGPGPTVPRSHHGNQP